MPDLESTFLEGTSWGADLNFKMDRFDPPDPPKPSSNLKKLSTAAAMLGLLYSMGHFTRPLLKATATQHKPWLLKVIDWALDKFKAVIDPGANYVQHHLSKGALHAQPELGSTFHWFAQESEALYTDVATLAHTTALGFERVSHHTIPVKIRHEVAPLRAQQRRLRVGLITLSHDEAQLRRFAHENVPLHGKQRLHKLEHHVYRRDEPLIGRALNLSRQARREARKAEADALRSHWTWAFAGAVPAFLFAARKLRLQSLLCRNTRSFTQEVCAMPNGWGRLGGQLLRELTGDLMAFLGVISVVVFAHELHDFLGSVTPWIKRGISELSHLSGEDYLGAAGGAVELLAPDYLS